MSDINDELIQLMREPDLSREEVSRDLNVPLVTVYQWTRTKGGKALVMMPTSELTLSKYTLMSENK